MPSPGSHSWFTRNLLRTRVFVSVGRSALLSTIRVLLADDSIQVREYVRAFLSNGCCEVVRAVGNGQTAVVAAAETQPDVVVLDLSMPVLNGIEAAKRILKAKPSTKIVFLSVEKDRDSCSAALQVGACGYVLKPRMLSDLLPAIKLAIDGMRFVSPGCE